MSITLICPKCKSDKVVFWGFKMTKNGMVQRIQCQKCGYVGVGDEKFDPTDNEKEMMRRFED